MLNRKLPIDRVHDTDEALNGFIIALTNKHLRDDLPKVTPQLRKNRFLTLGQARFALEREGNHPVLPPLMKKVRELFE